MTTGREKATEQQRAIGERAQRGVLERVAAAIENELGITHDVELVLSGETDRMHRVSHPMYMDEPVYLRVTASWLPADEARRLFPDDTDTKIAAMRAEPQAIRNGFTGGEAKDPEPCKAGNTKGNVCGGTISEDGTCDRAFTHAALRPRATEK